jgi:hypothetical protein
MSVMRRLESLESLARANAVDELRQAWANLTDEEAALVLGPYADGRREPTPEESAIAEKLRASIPEELIATAIGLEDGMKAEEINRRMKALVNTLGVFERGSGIRSHLRAARGRKRRCGLEKEATTLGRPSRCGA